MTTLRRFRSVSSIVCLLAAFLMAILIFLFHKSDVLESRMNRIVHTWKVEDLDESLKQPPHGDNTEINEPRISVFSVHGTGTEIDGECVPLSIAELGYNTRICIYDVAEDKGVSGSLQKTGAWEKDIMMGFGMQLRAHPDSIFLDVGSHLGAYTMQATALGHKVIAIDPLQSNLLLLSKSIRLAHQEGNVTLLWNAVSNVHETVRLRFVKQNIGSTHIVRSGDGGRVRSVSAANYTVQTILLDDIVDRFQLRNKTIIMKMDIEGSEFLALLGASKLFRFNTVCFVSTEIVFSNVAGTLSAIVELMKAYGFELFRDPFLTSIVDNNNLATLHLDGFFKNKNCG